MTGRFWALLLALVTTSTALTGCLEAFEQFAPDEGAITAMEDRDLADGAASAWHPEAFLLGAASAETADARAGVALDGATGDGRAPFWYYAYGAPETEETRLFRVTQDGQVTPEEKLPLLMRGAQFENVALAGWEIDSDAALAAVAATDEVAGVFGGGNLSTLAIIGMAPGGASWVVTALSDAGFAVALVDAQTGEVDVQDVEQQDLQGYASALPMPTLATLFPDVHIEDEGTLNADKRSESYAFEAGEGMQGRFEVQASVDAWHESLEFWIVDGEEVYLLEGRIRGYDGDAVRTFEFDVEHDGAYMLVVRHATPTDWVTDDLALGEVDYAFDLRVSYDLPERDAEA